MPEEYRKGSLIKTLNTMALDLKCKTSDEQVEAYMAMVREREKFLHQRLERRFRHLVEEQRLLDLM
jgi:hypothetical protein